MCICCGYCRLFTEFYKWKCAEEDSTLSLFTKAHGDRTRERQTTVQSYYCHRSGHCQQKPRTVPPEDTGVIENWSLLPCCYVCQSEPVRYCQSSYDADVGVVPLRAMCLVFANLNIHYPDLSVYFKETVLVVLLQNC